MMMACFARLYIHVINLFIKIIAMLNSVAKLNTFFFTMFYYVSVATTVCWEMFAVEYFGEFRELYTTRGNKNCEDMGVVASKHHVNRLLRHCIITSSEILLFQAHTEHCLQVSLLLPLIHCQQQSLSN